MTEVRKLLGAARLVTFTGPGGVGKSRLAVEVARDASRAFRDGVWLVELASVLAGVHVPDAIAQVLGVHDDATNPADRLVDHVADRQLLIILDNCEYLVDSCGPLIGKLLAGAPDLRLIATSRHVLGVEGEHTFPVPALTPDREAVDLFVDRAAAARPDFRVDAENRQAVERICRRLDGLPLALELAAVRLRAFSLDEIDDRLGNALSLLTGGPRFGAPRQRTLRATIEWSYQLCSAEEQLLWSRVTVFTGEFGLDAAEVVCSGDGIERGAVIDLLAGLVDKSILVRLSGTLGRYARFRMLGFVRQFGQEQAIPSDESVLRARHRDYFLALAEHASAKLFGPQGDETLNALRREQPNLRSALDYCMTAPGQAATGLRMAITLRSYWRYAGLVREGRQRLLTALRLNPDPTPERGHALAACGHFAVLMDDVDSARQTLDEARALGEHLGDRAIQAEVLHRRALVVLATGEGDDVPRALSILADALRAYRDLGDASNVTNVLFLMALLSLYIGDSRTQSLCEECLSLAREHDDSRQQAYGRCVLGLLNWQAGENSTAATLLRLSLRMFRPATDAIGTMLCLTGLAWVASASGAPERAATLLGAAHEASRRSGTILIRAHQRYLGTDAETRIRQALGSADFDRAFLAGTTLSADAATEYALQDRSDTRQAQIKTTDDHAALTRRERQIARLVADGMTNREIAVELVISQRTAEAHVENILRKLGFRSRTQIASWVSDHGAH